MRDWLREVAARLGVADPSPLLGALLDRTFAQPTGDPGYAANSLAPGAAPLELSFSEPEPAALRLDLEPFEPGLDQAARRSETTAAVATLVGQSFGPERATQFTKAVAPWLAPAPAHFGAYAGAAFDAGGLAEATVYFDLPRVSDWTAPGRAATLVRCVRDQLPGVVPLMHAVSAGRSGLAERVSLVCLDDFRLLDLIPLLDGFGLAARAPTLVDTALALGGGRFTMPAGTVVVGVRTTPVGIEVKLELLGPCLPGDPLGCVAGLLATRPHVAAAFRHWCAAVVDGCPRDARPGTINVVSARVRPDTGVALNVYLRPAALDALCGTRTSL